jgi:hypothetical protein
MTRNPASAGAHLARATSTPPREVNQDNRVNTVGGGGIAKLNLRNEPNLRESITFSTEKSYARNDPVEGVM